MAKYSKRAEEIAAELMEEFNETRIKPGRGNKGGKENGKKRPIANRLSDSRNEDADIPGKKSKNKYYAR